MGYDRSRYEILSPAGNPDKLRAAVEYGADAVYLSGQSYGLRAFSDNFNEEEMKAEWLSSSLILFESITSKKLV